MCSGGNYLLCVAVLQDASVCVHIAAGHVGSEPASGSSGAGCPLGAMEDNTPEGVQRTGQCLFFTSTQNSA